MARASNAQNAYHGGEWSLTAQGRFDLPQYKTAMNVCLNAVLLETGAWTRRPGTALAAFTRNGAAGRVVKWDFEQAAPYTMEFTDGYLRFYAGNTLVTNTDTQSVSAISSANPAVVQTGGTHGWVTGQQFVFQNLSVVDPYLLNRTFIGTVTDSTHLSLADAVTGTTLNGSLLQAFGTGTIARVVELSTPYGDALWSSLRSVQAETQSVLLQASTPPQVLTAIPPAGATPAVFSLTKAQFVDGPYNDPVGLATLTPASVNGTVGFTITAPAWAIGTTYKQNDMVSYSGALYQSLVNQNSANEPDISPTAWVAFLTTNDLGRQIRFFSEPPLWAAGTTYAAQASVKYNNTYFTALVGSNTGNTPGIDATKWGLNPGAATWAFGKIVSLTGAVATLISAATGTFTGLSHPFPNNIAAAFDGATTQLSGACAQVYNGGAPTVSGPNTIGKNFTSSAKAISYAVIFAPSDTGFLSGSDPTLQSLTLKLYGSSTAPTTTSNGTLLGTAANVPYAVPGAQVQIFSSDAVTTWNYIWVEFTLAQPIFTLACAEVQFYTTGAFSGLGLSATLDQTSPNLLYTTVFPTWRLGLFTPTNPYPACGTYHEGRLWLSGLVSNRLDASALIDINNNPATSKFYFTPTLADGVVTDACAIDYTLDGPDVNAIFWLQPDQQGILAGTQAGEWLVQASALNSPLSPLNMQAHRVTKIGCANIEPRHTEHTNVFVQKNQHKIMEYFPDIFSGKFTAPNLTEKAAHLSDRGIAELAYQQNLSPTIWARCNDGSLIGAAYKRDTLMTSQGPTYIGWHRHTLGSGRTVESITVGPSPATAKDAAGVLDTLAMVTSDGAYRQVEFLTNIFDETRVASDAWFVDSGIIGVTTQAVTSGGRLGMQVSGLWRLNGKTCAVVCGGYDCGDFAVANGKTFVPYTNDPAGIFTQAFATAATQTIVGFTYNSDGQLLRAATPQESGARTGPALGKKRRTDHVALLLNQTQGLKYGVTFANDAKGNTQLKTANFQTPGGTLYAVNALYSGVWWDALPGGDDFDSMICWRISRPYPGTIAASEGWLDTKDA